MFSRPVKLASVGALTAALALIGGNAVDAQTSPAAKPMTAAQAAAARQAVPADVMAAAEGAVKAGAKSGTQPTSSTGQPLTQLAGGLQIPTAFAFGDGQVFVSDGGNEDGTTAGGVFVIQNHTATLLPGSPAHV